MTKNGIIYCFYADNHLSKWFNLTQFPEWLSVETDWRGYRISTVPWVADVARILGILTVEDTLEAWLTYLEELGFQQVIPVCCEVFYEDKLYS
jgi:hypothetical protein